ncbi:MAG: 50S ribosomal protein L30 [Candidatus Bathyarchaeota archaeon]|nr:50S ribosomal protein L30 [Candidatus Bathyarchaeota archaeon]
MSKSIDEYKVKSKCLLVVRVRGTVNVCSDVKYTLKLLRLEKPNHATLVPVSPQYLGMLQKAKDYITWGEASKEAVIKLLQKRGEIVGGGKLTEEYLRGKGFKSFEEVAEKLCNAELKLKELNGVKPVFRLHPPSKGFKKTLKRSFSEGGELGYRGEKINELVLRMT